MSTEFVPIYSRRDVIAKRVNADETAKNKILELQKYADDEIDHKLRRHIGNFDINGFQILLPLNSSISLPIIDFVKKEITLPFENHFQKMAEDMVIAMYRYDTAEAEERLDRIEENFKKHLEETFGVVTNYSLDFTSQLLRTEKIMAQEGSLIQSQTLSVNDNVFLASQT